MDQVKWSEGWMREKVSGGDGSGDRGQGDADGIMEMRAIEWLRPGMIRASAAP